MCKYGGGVKMWGRRRGIWMAHLVGCWVGFYGNPGAGAVPRSLLTIFPLKCFFKKQNKIKNIVWKIKHVFSVVKIFLKRNSSEIIDRFLSKLGEKLLNTTTAALSNLFTGSAVGFDRRHDGWIQITEERDKKRKEFAQQIPADNFSKISEQEKEASVVMSEEVGKRDSG